MNYVYSTITADMSYTIWAKNGPKDIAVAEKTVKIKGGTGVATKQLVTPRGVVTAVTDDELETLEACELFRFHRDKGFLIVDKKKNLLDKVIKDMNLADKSRPLVPTDFVKKDDRTNHMARTDV